MTENNLTTTTEWAYDGIALKGLSATRSDGATWSVDYLYDEAGRLFAGAYASGAASIPFQVVTTDRGDVRELRDADGAAFAFYGYDAYGDPTCALSKATTAVASTVAAAIASRQPLRYASYAYDAHSGLYYCSQRYYDPEVGAFVSKDPARADGEESAYQYCTGDPVGKVDPTGKYWQIVRKYFSRRVSTVNLLVVKFIKWSQDRLEVERSGKAPKMNGPKYRVSYRYYPNEKRLRRIRRYETHVYKRHWNHWDYAGRIRTHEDTLWTKRLRPNTYYVG